MKMILVMWPDSVDITLLPKGTTVSLSDGTETLQDGEVFSLLDLLDPPPPGVVPHIHTVIGETSPPTP